MKKGFAQIILSQLIKNKEGKKKKKRWLGVLQLNKPLLIEFHLLWVANCVSGSWCAVILISVIQPAPVPLPGEMWTALLLQTQPHSEMGNRSVFLSKNRKWRHSRDDYLHWMLEPELIFCPLSGTGWVFMLKAGEGRKKKAITKNEKKVLSIEVQCKSHHQV